MSFSLMFPCQGSQYNGMFKEHFSEFTEFKEAIDIGENFYKENHSIRLKNFKFVFEAPKSNFAIDIPIQIFLRMSGI